MRVFHTEKIFSNKIPGMYVGAEMRLVGFFPANSVVVAFVVVAIVVVVSSDSSVINLRSLH